MPIDKQLVEDAIEQLRPSFNLEGGDIHLVNVSDDGVVEVKLTGACSGCPMSFSHLKTGVEQYLISMVPGVSEVVTND